MSEGTFSDDVAHKILSSTRAKPLQCSILSFYIHK